MMHRKSKGPKSSTQKEGIDYEETYLPITKLLI